MAGTFNIESVHFKTDEILFHITYNELMKIIRQLEEQNGFSHNEKEISNYILEKKDRILSRSAAELARDTYIFYKNNIK